MYPTHGHSGTRRPSGPPPGWSNNTQGHHSDHEPPYPVSGPHYVEEPPLPSSQAPYTYSRRSAGEPQLPHKIHFSSRPHPPPAPAPVPVHSHHPAPTQPDPYSHNSTERPVSHYITRDSPHSQTYKRSSYPSRPPEPPAKDTYQRPMEPHYSHPPTYVRPPSKPPSQSQRYPQSQPQRYPPGQSYEPQHGYQRPAAVTPPLNPQTFQHGNNTMNYQYSNCSGKRKAVLIGINYIGTKNQLKGCINDVKNMSEFLNKNYGYKYENMVILTDDQKQLSRVPTRANIIRAMQWLVRDAQPHDSLFLHYSGHGGRTEDLNGDEESGFDDVIYPVDFQKAGFLLDDDMHAIMVNPLLPGVRLTALFDSCHSGTALDLPYVYSTKGVIKEPNALKDVGTGAMDAFKSYSSGNIGGALKTLEGLFSGVSRSANFDREAVIKRNFSPADVISISGCKDSQTSADSNEGGVATGAMSWSFISTLHSNPQQSYLSLLNTMRGKLAPKYTQKPQLSSSHPIDMNLKFLL